MKTNVVLKSCDRNLFGITIKQNTKDGQMLSVSDLTKSYEVARYQYGWSDRRLNDIMKHDGFQERCYYILNEQGLIKTTLLAFMNMVKNEGVVNVLKGLGVWKTKGRGENKSVYADPYIWVLLAMEFNPMIYAKVVIWLTDSLIFNRIEAGTYAKVFTGFIKEVVSDPDYRKYFTLINTKVFGKHESGIRDTASADQLRVISDFEKFICQSIKMKLIRNEIHLLNAINMYNII